MEKNKTAHVNTILVYNPAPKNHDLYIKKRRILSLIYIHNKLPGNSACGDEQKGQVHIQWCSVF
jgi:hypothetical protein